MTLALRADADAPASSTTARPSEEAATPAKSARRVYVLHSGLHTVWSDPVKNIAAETLKSGLHKRGVESKDLVVLENPFPNASWRSMLPVSSISMFFDSIEPSSRMSQESYLRMHKALQAQGVERTDHVTWIGHSAGGQIGLTMAHLARNLWKFPELAREAMAYQVDMVITLGTPVGSDHLPTEVKLRHYYSSEDRVVRWASRVGPWVAWPLGYRARINKIPQQPGENCMIRCFGEVEHPYWDVDQRVLDRIVGETSPDYRPPWQAQLHLAGWGLSLSELLCRGLEAQCHISVEDPPRQK